MSAYNCFRVSFIVHMCLFAFMLEEIPACKLRSLVFLHRVSVFTCFCVRVQSLGAQSGDDFAGMRAALHSHISVMCEMARKVKAGN